MPITKTRGSKPQKFVGTPCFVKPCTTGSLVVLIAGWAVLSEPSNRESRGSVKFRARVDKGKVKP